MSNSFWTGRVVVMLYVRRGERRTYRIVPRYIRFGSNEWHSEDQWLMVAQDISRGVEREFAMRGILALGKDSDQSLPWRT